MVTQEQICVIEKKQDITALVNRLKSEGKVVGFVPTMGALHVGHMSLIDRSIAESDVTIVSIYVNPTQFNNPEDLKKYPRTFETDYKLCQEKGVFAIFAPDSKEMYPAPQKEQFIIVPPAGYKNKLCGEFRPGHFEGVATVVTKLLNIVPANKAYFGLKDAQQLFIIKKMVEDLCVPIEIIACETQREPDGLACSSRNVNLDDHSRNLAPNLYKTLSFIKSWYDKGEVNFELISSEAIQKFILPYPKISLEYLQAFDYNNLSETTILQKNTLIAIAAQIGTTRLIDNTLL
jgi:pantoate--beta-alanine ligase